MTKKVLGDNTNTRIEKRVAKTPNQRLKGDITGQAHSDLKIGFNKYNTRDTNMMSPLQLKSNSNPNIIFSQKENVPFSNTNVDKQDPQNASLIQKPFSPILRSSMKPFTPRQVNFHPAEPKLTPREAIPSVVVTYSGMSDKLVSPRMSLGAERTETPGSMVKSPFSTLSPTKLSHPSTPYKSPSSCLSPGKSPSSPRSPNRPISPLDEQRLLQRQKQIDYGYRTVGYLRFRLLISKDQRKPEHPRTPKKTQGCSKRSWDGQLKKWRRDLHLWDPDNLDAFRAMLNSELVVSMIAANPELSEIVDIVRDKMDNPTSPAVSDEVEESSTPALEDSIGFSDTTEKIISPSRIGNDPNFQRVARALVF